MARQGDNTAKFEARIKALEGALKNLEKTANELQKSLEKKMTTLEKDMIVRTKFNNKVLIKSKANQDRIEGRVDKLEKSSGGAAGQSQQSRGRQRSTP